MDAIETTPMGSRRHSYVGKKGDLRVELHFAEVHKVSCGREACLYIFRAAAPKDGALLPMCQMWVFDPRDTSKRKGNVDRERLYLAVDRLAKHLYGFVTQSDQHRVLDLLCDYLGDLKDHPVETGMDPTLDEWLADASDKGFDFFMEVNGERVVG